MTYFQCRCDVLDQQGKKLGSLGDVIELPMDSDDKGTRLRAEAIFVRNGKHRALVEVDAPTPSEPSTKKKSAKKAAYKTKDTIAESHVDEAATD